MPEFAFQELLPVDHNDATPYRLLSPEHVSTFDAAGPRSRAIRVLAFPLRMVAP